MARAESPSELDLGDEVDSATFAQILEMDEDGDDRDFSSSIVFGFFSQAETTFVKMDQALKDKDLNNLSELGHFLKGSSATLGFTIVKDACEKIQNLGKMKNETGDVDVDDEDKNLKKIAVYKQDAETSTENVEKTMLQFYGLSERPDA